MKLTDYIKETASTRETMWNGIFIYVKDDLSNDVSLKNVLMDVNNKLPDHLMRYVDSIYVGQFEDLANRNLNAMFKDGAIYVSNEQDNEDDMCDDIIHEFAHSIEEQHKTQIYGDVKIENEFLAKRKELYYILQDEGYKLDSSYFLNPEYDQNFDNFLYQEIGYPVLTMLTVNTFYSPYAATSLSEYFANGFEAYYYHRDVERIKAISPELFDKLTELLYNKDNEY